MKRALSFPKIFGISIYIHWTFSILIAWIIYSNLRAGLDWLHVGWMVLFVLSLFVCVTLHELGHALAARHYGILTRDITLYPIGGIARLEKMPEKPSQELVVAFAGPAVNVVIMLLLLPFIAKMNIAVSESETALLINESNFLAMLGIINVWLALFNLIPAFPMDGGRVLRALLAMKTGRVRATNIAATVGKILAAGFVFAGFYLNPFLIFIGLFIILGAHSEAKMVQAQSYISGFTARHALMTDVKMLDVKQRIFDAVKMLLDGEAKNFLLMKEGKPYGIVTRDHIIKGLREQGEDTGLETIADTQLYYADINTPLEEIFNDIQRQGNPLVLITENGQLAGAVDFENISELIMVNSARSR